MLTSRLHDRRAAPVARNELQKRDGGAARRWRQSGDPRRHANRTKTRGLLDAFARAVDSLGGRYITAQDVGMSEDDMVTLSQTTKHVAGLPGQGGDPGPYTARGVYLGVKAAAKRHWVAKTIKGRACRHSGCRQRRRRHCALSGAEGAKLTLADVNADRAAALAAELGAETVATATPSWRLRPIFSAPARWARS
jgi:glutamate dehydrogenase/leucine dehydrogenase